MTLDLFDDGAPAWTVPVRVIAAVGEARRGRGAGLTLRYGYHACPFGTALVLASGEGIAGLAFVDERQDPATDSYDREGALANMRARWPGAEYVADAAATEPHARHAFDPAAWRRGDPLSVHLIGSAFDVMVWRALLDIPVGATTTYAALARDLGRPTAARAIGGAVGRNPVSMIVPCHRVLGTSGAITGYHWGTARKRAMLDWERALTRS